MRMSYSHAAVIGAGVAGSRRRGSGAEHQLDAVADDGDREDAAGPEGDEPEEAAREGGLHQW